MEQDQWVTASELSRLVDISLPTVYLWAKQGHVRRRAALTRQLFSLHDAREHKAPKGRIPVPVAAERIGVSCTQLRAWSNKGRIPPLEKHGDRALVMPERDVPRIKAWYIWFMPVTPKYGRDCPGDFDFGSAARTVASFEHAIALGHIPARFSSDAFDVKGRRT